MLSDGWKKARPIERYYKETGRPVWDSGLSLVDVKMEAYGDWYLYEDEDGNYWEEYCSIGD